MSRAISIFGVKKGWFGNVSKKFVAEIFVRDGKLVVEAINDEIEEEVINAVQLWEKKHGNPHFVSGDTAVNKDGSETSRTFMVRQSINDKEYLDAVAEAILMEKTFGGYYVRGFRVKDGDKKIMDIGVLK